MSPAFDDALTDAISLLTALPVDRSGVEIARRHFEAYRERHRSVPAELALDSEPGRDRVEYDLLLDAPNGGTLALTYRQDHGTPWLADYAEHWAASYVVSVGDANLNIQDALLFLRLAADERADIGDALVDEAIIARELRTRQVVSTPDEEQDAADHFRRRLGLESAAATRDWLSRRGLDARQFQLLISGGVRRRKLQKQVVNGEIESYFAAHAPDFDMLRALRVTVDDETHARAISKAARSSSLLEFVVGPHLGDADVTMRTERAGSLPPEIRALSIGQSTDPLFDGKKWYVAQLLERRSASLDAATRFAVDEAVFRAWLDDERRRAVIRWHWI